MSTNSIFSSKLSASAQPFVPVGDQIVDPLEQYDWIEPEPERQRTPSDFLGFGTIRGPAATFRSKCKNGKTRTTKSRSPCSASGWLELDVADVQANRLLLERQTSNTSQDSNEPLTCAVLERSAAAAAALDKQDAGSDSQDEHERTSYFRRQWERLQIRGQHARQQSLQSASQNKQPNLTADTPYCGDLSLGAQSYLSAAQVHSCGDDNEGESVVCRTFTGFGLVWDKAAVDAVILASAPASTNGGDILYCIFSPTGSESSLVGCSAGFYRTMTPFGALGRHGPRPRLAQDEVLKDGSLSHRALAAARVNNSAASLGSQGLGAGCGHASQLAEALSFELLHRVFAAKLEYLEMEIMYSTPHPKRLDYICSTGGEIVGVSVTRLFSAVLPVSSAATSKRGAAAPTRQETRSLLEKKLQNMRTAIEQVDSRVGLSKRISFLHVWVANVDTAAVAAAEFESLLAEQSAAEQTPRVMLLLTMASFGCELEASYIFGKDRI